MWLKRLAVSSALLVLVTFGLSCAKPAVGDAKQAAIGWQIGNAAPDFTLSDSDGKSVSLHSILGKPLVLNFWASW